MGTNQSWKALGATWSRPGQSPLATQVLVQTNTYLGYHLQDFGWVIRYLAHTRDSTHCVVCTRRQVGSLVQQYSAIARQPRIIPITMAVPLLGRQRGFSLLRRHHRLIGS